MLTMPLTVLLALLIAAVGWAVFVLLSLFHRPPRRPVIPAPVPLPTYDGRHRKSVPIGGSR